MRLARFSCSAALNGSSAACFYAGGISQASLRPLPPRARTTNDACASGVLIFAKLQNKRGHYVLFYFALGAIRLGFAPRSRRLALKPYGLCRLVPLAIRTHFIPSVRKSAERFDKACALCAFCKSCQN